MMTLDPRQRSRTKHKALKVATHMVPVAHAQGTLSLDVDSGKPSNLSRPSSTRHMPKRPDYQNMHGRLATGVPPIQEPPPPPVFEGAATTVSDRSSGGLDMTSDEADHFAKAKIEAPAASTVDDGFEMNPLMRIASSNDTSSRKLKKMTRHSLMVAANSRRGGAAAASSSRAGGKRHHQKHDSASSAPSPRPTLAEDDPATDGSDEDQFAPLPQIDSKSTTTGPGGRRKMVRSRDPSFDGVGSTGQAGDMDSTVEHPQSNKKDLSNVQSVLQDGNKRNMTNAFHLRTQLSREIQKRGADFALESASSSAKGRTVASAAVHHGDDKESEHKMQWMDDSATKHCLQCHQTFYVLRRRHHCRACFKIFCAKCTRDRINGRRICQRCKRDIEIQKLKLANSRMSTRFQIGGAASGEGAVDTGEQDAPSPASAHRTLASSRGGHPSSAAPSRRNSFASVRTGGQSHAVDLGWVADDEVDACTLCLHRFTVSRWRHHCRMCGNIFCAHCSSKRVKSNRVCELCYAISEGKDWEDENGDSSDSGYDS